MFQLKGKSSGMYQFSPSPYGSHIKIIKYVGKNKKVLDVGAATGYLAERFKNNGCYVAAIESDKKSAEIAKQYCDNIIIKDVEKITELPHQENFFDVIVFADVLEHLKRPDIVLTSFKKYLKPEGIIIVSLPNIARFDIRLKLLLGRFDYEEGGILDKTHLRFFTLNTAKKLLESSGYRITHIDFTSIISKFKVLRCFSTWLAFQFIIVAKYKA